MKVILKYHRLGKAEGDHPFLLEFYFAVQWDSGERSRLNPTWSVLQEQGDIRGTADLNSGSILIGVPKTCSDLRKFRAGEKTSPCCFGWTVGSLGFIRVTPGTAFEQKVSTSVPAALEQIIELGHLAAELTVKTHREWLAANPMIPGDSVPTEILFSAETLGKPGQRAPIRRLRTAQALSA